MRRGLKIPSDLSPSSLESLLLAWSERFRPSGPPDCLVVCPADESAAQEAVKQVLPIYRGMVARRLEVVVDERLDEDGWRLEQRARL